MSVIDMNFDSYDGIFTKNAKLGEKSWFKCGGNADLLFEPRDVDDLSLFLKEYPKNESLTVIGSMANCIIRNSGIRGCVISLGKPFSDIEINGTRIMAGAGALNGTVASSAAKSGIAGLEFLSGIPGTIGGSLSMNAGAYGVEIKDKLIAAMALNKDGKFVPFTPKEMNMEYRHCNVPSGTIFVAAIFEGDFKDKDLIKERLKEIKSKRQNTQPISDKTGGSTFANPSISELKAAGLAEDTRTWQLIEKIGGGDLKVGGAAMSDKHLNFMINTGSASASDLENLGNDIIKRVQDKFNLTLRWEIKFLGEK